MPDTKVQENSIIKKYGQECTLSKDEFIKRFKINENGL